MEKWKNKLVKYAFLLLNILFSVYLYSHVVEKALFVDLNYIDSIVVSNLPDKITENVQDLTLTKESAKLEGFYGTPIAIRVPKLSLHFDLNPAIKSTHGWKVSNTKAYIWTYSESEYGLLGDSLIFSRETYLPMNSIALITEGDRLVLSTDKGWNYTYRVSKKYITPYNESPILASQPSSLVLVKGLNDINGYLVLEAAYVSLEEETQ